MPTDYVASIHSDPGAWQATHAYAALAYVRPVTPNSLQYQTTAGGPSGGSEPTWPLVVGNTVIDGSVTWTCVGDMNAPGLGAPPIITVPVNGDGGVPQAIVTAIGMLADLVYAAAINLFSTVNSWTAKQTFTGTGGGVTTVANTSNVGVAGTGGANGAGVFGEGGSGNGNGGTFQGTGTSPGVYGAGGSSNGNGVVGQAVGTGVGVSGTGASGTASDGVLGTAVVSTGVGVKGVGGSGTGVLGTSSGANPGVQANNTGTGSGLSASANAGLGALLAASSDGNWAPLKIAPSATPTAATVGCFYVDTSGGLWFCATAGTWTQITVP